MTNLQRQMWALLSDKSRKCLAFHLGQEAARTDDHSAFDMLPAEARDEFNRGYCDARWGQLS